MGKGKTQCMQSLLLGACLALSSLLLLQDLSPRHAPTSFQLNVRQVQFAAPSIPENAEAKFPKATEDRLQDEKWNIAYCRVPNGTVIRGMGSQIDQVTEYCRYPREIPLCRQNSFQQVENAELFLYSAFLTTRIKKRRHVLIVGLKSRFMQESNLYCTIWYGDGTITSVAAHVEQVPIPPENAVYAFHAHFVWCPEVRGRLPSHVSVSSAPCGRVTNVVMVLNRLEPWIQSEDGIAICTRGIWGVASPASFTEWMEMHRMMGVNKVILYDYQNVSQAMETMIKYYEAANFLHVQKWRHHWKATNYPAEGAGEVYANAQFALHNDCLYRFGRDYAYLLYIDRDELLIPGTEVPTNYRDMIKYALTHVETEIPVKEFTVLHFRRTHFCTDAPFEKAHTGILSSQFYNERLSVDYPGGPGKNVVNSSAVGMMGVHEVKMADGNDELVFVQPRIAKIHHYSSKRFCNETDDSTAQFGERLQSAVMRAFEAVGITV